MCGLGAGRAVGSRLQSALLRRVPGLPLGSEAAPHSAEGRSRWWACVVSSHRDLMKYLILLESPLACKEIWLVHTKGDQSWTFTGRTDAEAEAPILWPLDAKNWLTGKDPDAGEDWRREEKGTTEDEMVGWHHRLDGHEFEQALGVGDGQGSLACCSPWGHKESDTTEWLNWLTLFYRWGNWVRSGLLLSGPGPAALRWKSRLCPL